MTPQACIGRIEKDTALLNFTSSLVRDRPPQANSDLTLREAYHDDVNL